MNEFKIGDRVRMVKDYNFYARAEMSGEIVCLNKNKQIGVCFDEYNSNFHTCYGKCKDGHGYYIDFDCLVKLNKSNTKTTSNKRNNFLPPDVADVIIHNNTVVVNLKDGRKGVSKCSDGDEFDAYCGFVNAYYRAKNDHVFDLKNILKNCVKSAEKKGYKQAILRNN